MPDPKKHADSRGILESIGRWIPGFSGYLEREYRREADALARKWLADRLDKAKPSLDDFVQNLTSAGVLDGLDQVDRFRSKLDHMVGRFRSAPQGYSGFFDYVRIKEEQLNEVYMVDVSLFQTVDELGAQIEALKSSNQSPGDALAGVTEKLSEINRSFDQRNEILVGLGE